MTIASLEVMPLRIPRRRAPKLGGRTTDPWASHVVVKLTTDDGAVGWGECRPHRQWSYETLESAATTLSRYLAPALVGHDVEDIRGLHVAMDTEIAPNVARGQPIAKSAVDMAVHDLRARVMGESLAAMLGAQTPVNVGTNALLSPTTAAEAERQAAAFLERGFESFKLNLGHGLRTDLAMAAAVKGVAGDRYVLCEANQAYDFDTALAIGQGLQALGIDAFEQPLRANAIAELRELKNRLDVPIQLDESVFGPEDLVELIKLDAVEAVTLKVSKAGGLAPAVETARIARDAGLAIAGSGLAEAGLGLAASAAFFASVGLTRNLTLNGPQLLESDIVHESLLGEGGRVAVPVADGLGVTPDLAAIERYRFEV